MAAKLKLSEVRGDVVIGSANGGKGAAVHALKLVEEKGGAAWHPYCATKAKTPFRSWGAAHEQVGQERDFELCVKCSALVEIGPVEIQTEEVTIPGLDRAIKVKRAVAVPVETTETSTTHTEDKEADMAAKTMDKAAQEKAEQEIRAGIERLVSLIAEGKDDSVKELTEELNKDRAKITGTGAAGIKAKLRADQEKAVKEAEAAKAEAPKAEVVSPETQNWEDIPGAKEKITDAAKRVGEALTANMKFSQLAREIAKEKMILATGFTNKHGDPDLMFASDALKNAFRQMTAEALVAANLPDTFEGRKTLEKFLKAVQNQHAAARRDFVLALDNEHKELAPRFKRAREAHPDKPVSEAVFEFHKVSRGKTKLELEEEEWNKERAAELAAAQRKELTDGSGEGGEGEGEGSDEGEGDGETKPEPTYSDILKIATAAVKATTKLKTAKFSALTDEELAEIEKQAKALEDAAKEIRKALIV